MPAAFGFCESSLSTEALQLILKTWRATYFGFSGKFNMPIGDADAAVAKTATVKNIQKALAARILKRLDDGQPLAEAACKPRTSYNFGPIEVGSADLTEISDLKVAGAAFFIIKILE